MDFRIAAAARRRKRRRLLIGVGAGLAAAALLTALSFIGPGAPEASRDALWTGTVERGSLVLQVRGPGSLEVPPEEIRWLAAETRGRVEERHVLPGTPVDADTLLLALSNPELEQQVREAEHQLQAEEADLRGLRERNRSDLLEQESAAGELAAASERARRRAEADRRLEEAGLVGEFVRKRSEVRAEEFETRRNLEQQRLAILADSSAAQIAAKEATVARYQALVALRRRQQAGLLVRAGRSGILLELPVEVGQEVRPGENLARVADPQRLKAVLRIPETRARDVAPGRPAVVDTRNGVIPGVVTWVDPAVRDGAVAVDIALMGPLPRGARPDLSVEGAIELDRIEDTLHLGRPAYGQPGSSVGLFRVTSDGEMAVRTAVRLGRASVNRIEILEGLAEGDEVVLSDTSTWDAHPRIRLR